MIIGSGPIVIGQACEFDYSGTQACKALRSLGYEIVLANSNPATIMTDPGMADVTYLEPLNVARMAEIIEKERPDALLPNLGGQSGLNLSSELARGGVLDRFGVKVIGVNVDAIERGEDREAFKATMTRLGIDMPKSELAYSLEEAETIAAALGYPVVIRPAYTMGGTGGGLVYNVEELRTVAQRGLAASLIGQILVEEAVVGWEELELEVVRDAKNQKITVCFIENIDAMGVHTGDSFCAAPMLTISPELQRRLEKHSYDVVDAIEVIGGTNVQFAHDPKTGRVVIIEINPRTSRSSALASKATGFPIAQVSAKLAGRADPRRDPVLARRHPREVHAVGRLRGDQVRAVGVREVPGGRGQARHADAGGRRGDEHREDLQGGLPEGDPLPRDRALRPRLRQGLQPPDARGAAADARGAVERAPVPPVRGAAEGRERRRAPPPHPRQGVVPRADEGARRAGGGDPRATRGGRSPTRSCAAPSRTASPTATSPGSSASRSARSASRGRRSVSWRRGMRCR